MSAPILIALSKNYITTLGIGKIKQEPGEIKQEHGDAGGSQLSRKRRLDNLSWEEKMQRKKMKNRVAAQTSRDRKKAKMDEMEYRIQSLESSNAKLAKDMATLKAINERLIGENEKLKSELSTAKDAAVVVVRADQSGPAESIPQQQETSTRTAATAAFTRLMMLCLLCQTSSLEWNQMSISTALSSLPKASSLKLIQKLKDQMKPHYKDQILEVLKEKWWGPHQSMWNPVKILT